MNKYICKGNYYPKLSSQSKFLYLLQIFWKGLQFALIK